MNLNKADRYLKTDIINILDNGYKDRNPRPRYSDNVPAHTLSIAHSIKTYDLSKGEFPITSLRPIAWKSGIKEMFWIYQDASNDLNLLRDKYNVHYWDAWESKEMPNTIGKTYGYVVKKYDLMNKLLDGLKNDPYGRRHIIDLFQYEELENTDGLYPCAFLTIWNVRNDGDGKEYLDMSLIQRSGDLLPAAGAGAINECQYAALQMMVARHCGYEVGMFTHFVANLHLYDRHMEAASEIVRRHDFEQLTFIGKLMNKESVDDSQPQLILNPDKTNFYDFTIEDFTMENYNPIKPQLTFPLGI